MLFEFDMWVGQGLMTVIQIGNAFARASAVSVLQTVKIVNSKNIFGCTVCVNNRLILILLVSLFVKGAIPIYLILSSPGPNLSYLCHFFALLCHLFALLCHFFAFVLHFCVTVLHFVALWCHCLSYLCQFVLPRFILFVSLFCTFVSLCCIILHFCVTCLHFGALLCQFVLPRFILFVSLFCTFVSRFCTFVSLFCTSNLICDEIWWNISFLHLLSYLCQKSAKIRLKLIWSWLMAGEC